MERRNTPIPEPPDISEDVELSSGEESVAQPCKNDDAVGEPPSLRTHRPGIRLSEDATRQSSMDIAEMYGVMQHLDYGSVAGEFFENEEIALAFFATLYRRKASMVIAPDGKELKYYGSGKMLMRSGRDVEMREWWLYHSEREEAASKLNSQCLNRPAVNARSRQALVVVNIYDVSAHLVLKGFNKASRLLGTGAYHAAIEVYGAEVSFGGFPADHENPLQSGLFFCGPRQCEAHVYRESVLLGRTELTCDQVSELIEDIAPVWPGCEYHLLERNCTHFSNAFGQLLGARELPLWVTHLAGKGADLVVTIKEGMDARRPNDQDGRYKLGDFSRGIWQRLVNDGKEHRGAARNSGYKFGDMTRGVTRRLTAKSISSTQSLDVSQTLSS